MEVITGQAKIDYEKWLLKNGFSKNSYTKDIILRGKMLYAEIPTSLQSALAIEWLDSEGILILIDAISELGTEDIYDNWYWSIKENDSDEDFACSLESDTEDYFANRKEATEKAIEKAVNIYNSKHVSTSSK